MKKSFAESMAKRVQNWMKQISIQSVGRSIPINFYEPKIPEEVLRLAQEWSKKRENYKNSHTL